jgi:hypothetical protein
MAHTLSLSNQVQYCDAPKTVPYLHFGLFLCLEKASYILYVKSQRESSCYLNLLTQIITYYRN